MKKEKKSPLSKAMSLAVRTRNAMPKYGPEWRKKIATAAGLAGSKARWKGHIKKGKVIPKNDLRKK